MKPLEDRGLGLGLGHFPTQPGACEGSAPGNANQCSPMDLLIPYKPQRSPPISLGLRCILRRTIFAPASTGLEWITVGASPEIATVINKGFSPLCSETFH